MEKKKTSLEQSIIPSMVTRDVLTGEDYVSFPAARA